MPKHEVGPKGQRLSQFNLILRGLLKSAALKGRPVEDIRTIFSEARSLASEVLKKRVTLAEAKVACRLFKRNADAAESGDDATHGEGKTTDRITRHQKDERGVGHRIESRTGECPRQTECENDPRDGQRRHG